MQIKTRSLPNLLRTTATRLEEGAQYEWGHMGRCNCGHLVQTLTSLDSRQIAEKVNHQLDEWTEHAQTYCQQTGSPVDEIFEELAKVGFSHKDVMALEHLNDSRVLKHLGNKGVKLRRNQRQDVSLYMRTLAEVIEKEKELVST